MYSHPQKSRPSVATAANGLQREHISHWTSCIQLHGSILESLACIKSLLHTLVELVETVVFATGLFAEHSCPYIYIYIRAFLPGVLGS